tara:strand:+ start:60 stop:614 length:555 start_codon:yes stop_codon:yes gene_type:complete
MEYKDKDLTFNSTNIATDLDEFVMMDWEDTIMAASAEYICSNGGDILEIGFGMGISANYIQSYTINSHTIIENHPAMIIKANAWAADKPNVTIIEGSWLGVKNTLSTYDGLFMDTYGDEDAFVFGDHIASLMKSGGKATWWNSISAEENWYNIPGVTYQMYNVNPPLNNGYFDFTEYYLPKKQY